MRRLLPLFLCLVLLLSACGAAAGSGDGQQTRIVLNGNSASVTGGGVKVSGSVISIGAAGSYIVSGTLDDGRNKIPGGEPGGERCGGLRAARQAEGLHAKKTACGGISASVFTENEVPCQKNGLWGDLEKGLFCGAS